MSEAEIIDGKAFAAGLRGRIAEAVATLKADRDLSPGLAVVLVGENPASQVYVRNKAKQTRETGMASFEHKLDVETSQDDLLALIGDLNGDPAVNGILVQLPLPDQIDSQAVLDAIDPAKDVDGFHPDNVGRLVQKRPRFVPCTPAGIMELLARHDIEVAGRRAVVIGRSDIVGKPMALLLMHAHATVTICHSRTANLAGVAREADLLVAAIGRAGLVRGEFVKPGAVVVDVGMNRVEDAGEARDLLEPARLARFEEKGYALVGDVHAPSVTPVAGALTPVPGGVGPLTIALLVKNTVRAAAAAAD
jgi:methylenetetrahydrofolate dehydrogenase (NADP+)/methenyltetrahydrofolate cyclohydrolase